jgi:hypothetical protein
MVLDLNIMSYSANTILDWILQQPSLSALRNITIRIRATLEEIYCVFDRYQWRDLEQLLHEECKLRLRMEVIPDPPSDEEYPRLLPGYIIQQCFPRWLGEGKEGELLIEQDMPGGNEKYVYDARSKLWKSR